MFTHLLGSHIQPPNIQAHATDTDAGTSIVVTKPTGTVDGDLLIGIVAQNNSTADLSPPGGWTIIFDDIGIGPAPSILMSVWYRVASSEGANYTFTSDTSQTLSAAVIRIDGQGATPINASANDTGTAAPRDAPSVTTTVENTLLLAILAARQATGSTPPSGMTELFDLINDHALSLAYVDFPNVAATGARTFTTDGSKWAAMMIAIAPKNT